MGRTVVLCCLFLHILCFEEVHESELYQITWLGQSLWTEHPRSKARTSANLRANLRSTSWRRRPIKLHIVQELPSQGVTDYKSIYMMMSNTFCIFKLPCLALDRRTKLRYAPNTCSMWGFAEIKDIERSESIYTDRRVEKWTSTCLS